MKIIESIIEAEAPVHKDRLAKLVGGAFGLSRVSEDRKRVIQSMVPDEFARSEDADFYRPTGIQPQTWRIVRVAKAGENRPIDEVSLVEIGNAMVVVAEQSGGAVKDDLKRQAMAMFGVKRMGAAVTACLDAALERAVAVGKLNVLTSGVVVTGTA